MGKNSKRAAAITAAAVVAIGGAGAAAYAAGWLTTGTATATASTSDVLPMTATIVLNDKIYPGRALIATAKFTNPNDFKVALDKVKVETASFTAKLKGTNTPNPDCQSTLSLSSVDVGTPTGTTVINPKSSSQTISLPVTIDDELDIKCAGSDLTMTIAFEGHSVA